jgi:hypothetical protein
MFPLDFFTRIMAHLVLDEQRIDAVFGEMTAERVPQAVHRQVGGQAGGGPHGGEAIVDVAGRDPPAALGRPQHRAGVVRIQGPHLAQVLLEHVHRPRHDRVHRSASGRAAPHGLAPTDVAHTEAPQLGGCRVGREVTHLQHGRLPPPQPPGVDHLEQRGVPKRRQAALAARGHHGVDARIGAVEERLQLLSAQWPPLRTAFVVGDMGGGVALVADLGRDRPHPLGARLHPPVARVTHVVQEHRNRSLVVADRRVRPATLGHPGLDVLGPPIPRPRVTEGLEAAHHSLPETSDGRAQPARRVLAPPALHHRLEQRLFEMQRGCSLHQHQRRRTRQRPRHTPPSPPCHRTPRCGARRNETRRRIMASAATKGVDTPYQQGSCRDLGHGPQRPENQRAL